MAVYYISDWKLIQLLGAVCLKKHNRYAVTVNCSNCMGMDWATVLVFSSLYKAGKESQTYSSM